MTKTPQILAIYYSPYSQNRRIAIRTREGYGLERIELRRFETLKSMLLWLISSMCDHDPTFADKLSAADDANFMKSNHRKRRYFSPNRDTLYLQRQSLVTQHSAKIGSHWLATNIGGTEVAQVVKEVATALGVPVLSPRKVDLHGAA